MDIFRHLLGNLRTGPSQDVKVPPHNEILQVLNGEMVTLSLYSIVPFEQFEGSQFLTTGTRSAIAIVYSSVNLSFFLKVP